jgi:hypothetical protein
VSYICRNVPNSIVGKRVDDGLGHYPGECVSLVKHLCPTLPPTALWRKGKPAKGQIALPIGTVLATFNASNKYEGHATIYVTQDRSGILVWDQYNHPPKPVGKRLLHFDDARTLVNNGNRFYVVE